MEIPDRDAASRDDLPAARRFFGRRHGKALRAAQQRLLDEVLPTLAIPPGDGPLDPTTLFTPPADALWLEIGFGGGEHLTAQAAANRRIGFIGAEAFMNGVVTALRAAETLGLDNLRIWSDDVRLLLDRLPDACLARVFVLFPDPWPKSRHHKRRLVAPPLLDALCRLMPPGAELRLATDHADYRDWMIDTLAAHPGFDGPQISGERPADWVPTRYEAKALAAGIPCAYLSAVRVG